MEVNSPYVLLFGSIHSPEHICIPCKHNSNSGTSENEKNEKFIKS